MRGLKSVGGWPSVRAYQCRKMADFQKITKWWMMAKVWKRVECKRMGIY